MMSCCAERLLQLRTLLRNCVTFARRFSTAPSSVKFDDYGDTKKKFKLTSPEYFNFAVDVIDQWALREVLHCNMLLSIHFQSCLSDNIIIVYLLFVSWFN